MSNTRNLADLLDSSGDIKSAALDNVDISGKLNTSGGTLTGTLTMESTDAGSAAAPELILYRNSASPADADYLGQIQFKGENDNGGSEIYAKVTGKITDASNGTEDGLIETAIKGNGSFTIVSRQKSNELQLLNGVNLDVAGNITVGGTVDGVDIQTLNTTAGAALPKAGGTMTGALNIGSVGNLTNSGSDLKITGTDDIFFNVAGASNNILQLYGGSSANDQSKFDSHVHPLTDNSKDLGNATERWKDLYLSGGLKVGGTNAAHTLDDYEEGTCSIQWSDGTNVEGNANNAFYTKVGRIVTVSGDIMSSGVSNLSQSLGLRLVGFPFNFAKNGAAPILTRNLDVPPGTVNVVIYHASSGSHAEIYSFTDHGAYSNVTVGDLHGSTNDMYFTVTYQTS